MPHADPRPSPRRGAGELEAAVLSVLWEAGRALSPREVQQALTGQTGAAELSYSTVVTILSRLHAKKALGRRRDGRAFRYAPVADEAGLAARRLAARLDPRHATWLLTGAAVVLAGCSTLALGLLAAAAVVRVPPVASFGHWSQRVLGRDTPAGIAVALLAMVLLSVAVLTVSGFVSRRCRALAGAYREARSLPGPGRTVVVADEAADAFALPGWPGRIVVTAGMLSALDEPGRAALLAHEQAHLAGFHYLFTTAARLAATASPLLCPAARAVEYTVERWADERAASVVGDRRLVAHAIGRAALAAKAGSRRRAAPAALGVVFSGARARAHAGAGPVPRRVAALLAPPPPRRLVLLAAVLALVALAGIR